MLDLDVQTLLLIVASASVQQRHQAIERLREQVPDLAARRLCWWLGANRHSYDTHWQQQADEREDGTRQVVERILRAFPGYRYWCVARALQCAGARMNYRRVAQIVCEQCCLCQSRRRLLPASEFAPRVPSLS